ncbi:beta-phosphoglucomutase family hydrolase [Chloroflexota bacterium]
MKPVRNNEVDLKNIAAVIFDTDGVLTDTASIHAQAWKQLFDEYLKKRAERHGVEFQSFDADSDYIRYLDGKPRYDGVKSFLNSRDISLPQGSPSDSPVSETVCGLGNRKNRYFLERLKKKGARAYDSSIRFIERLQARGIRTAVISASRNAEKVLEAAGIRELFYVKVDGVDSAELHLEGKPDPAIFLEAAKRLGVKPGETIIVEDALAGVEAGRQGKFRLVIGLDRTGDGKKLKKWGADIVVRDLSELEIRLPKSRKLDKVKAIDSLPSALEKKGEISRRLLERTLAEREISKGIWTLIYESYDSEQEGLREALCTLGNGYFATRGTSPESIADDIHYPGTYIAGCYNRLKTDIAGRTVENECMVNAPNWLPVTFRIEDGDWFDIEEMDILQYRQELDLRQGVLSRLVRFADAQGRQTRLFQQRLVSMSDPQLAGLETTLVAENWSGTLHIRSALDGRVTNSGVKRYRELNNQHLHPIETKAVGNETIYLQMETNQSHIRISEAARTRLFRQGEQTAIKPHVIQEPGYIAQEFTMGLEEGKMVTIEKIIALYTSKDHGISESGLQACKQVERAPSFYDLFKRQILSWDHLWQRCRIAIKDSERVAMVLHLHIYHLLQTVSPHIIEHDAGVPARGLHGEAYRGHIFWDELFIFPFLNLSIPDITQALLLYRYRRLPEARWAAQQAGYKGAMYPWQSSSDGREETQTLHLNPKSGRWLPDNSQRQRHINIAIAYNVWHYYQATGDVSFLSFYGAEMLIEIARFWASITCYNRSLDRYEIRRVMGPDEFHDAYPDADEPGIDNNAYTNIMTVWVLCRALEAIELLLVNRREALQNKLALSREELERWEDISHKMHVPFHGDGIISQFEGYDHLKEFDWEGYRKKYGDIQRLDRLLEAEGDTPNHYKLSKQADVLMLFYLLSADELREIFRRLNYPFEYETIPKNIDYYLERTSHGSTLSRVVHAWVLALSKRELSWDLFKGALESDVSDVQGGTTPEGIHLGAMAGTVDLIQRCYTGIETRLDRLQLDPRLPKDLKELRFNILYRQHWVNLIVTHNLLKVSTRPGTAAPIKISFRNKEMELKAGDTIVFNLLAQQGAKGRRQPDDSGYTF